MIFYYAIGGGLGHVTRGRRVLEALGLEAAFVTAGPSPGTSRHPEGRMRGVIQVPPEFSGNVEAHRVWIRDLCTDRLIVDTFPCGIQGELSELDIPMDLVARRLKWSDYRRAVPYALPQFDTVYCVEELEPQQLHELRAGRIETLSLSAPALSAAIEPYWLIVHSGPADEVRELIAYTEELMRVERPPERVLVATRCNVVLPDGFEFIDTDPAAQWMPAAARIISAAGFNTMLETEPWRDKHHVVPFLRTFDDQFYRAAVRRASSSSMVRAKNS